MKRTLGIAALAVFMLAATPAAAWEPEGLCVEMHSSGSSVPSVPGVSGPVYILQGTRGTVNGGVNSLFKVLWVAGLTKTGAVVSPVQDNARTPTQIRACTTVDAIDLGSY